MKTFEVVLATASPRRRELIKRIKSITPVFMPATVREVVRGGAEATAADNARLKGEWAAKRTAMPVLAFDTVVGLGTEVFGKPTDRADAERMFKCLCGRTHEVVTAVYLRVGNKICEKTEKTYVTFGAFDDALVYNYIDSGAPFDKAGGYNIDDPALRPLILRFDGDYDNVVGLPVALTEKLIEENLVHGEAGYSD